MVPTAAEDDEDILKFCALDTMLGGKGCEAIDKAHEIHNLLIRHITQASIAVNRGTLWLSHSRIKYCHIVFTTGHVVRQTRPARFLQKVQHLAHSATFAQSVEGFHVICPSQLF
ncbi:hypothetical protein D3C72_1980360 [compost metagenome]